MHIGSPLTAEVPPVPAAEGGGARGTLVVLGVRGGVGTSTLAAALDAPDHGVDVTTAPTGAAVVLVTSPSVADTRRLLPLVDRCHVRGHGPIVVAVVSDGHGRWPAASRARLRMIRDLAEVVEVPWVPRWRWRGVDDGATAGWGRAVARIAEASRAPSPDQILVAHRPSRRRRRWRKGDRS